MTGPVVAQGQQMANGVMMFRWYVSGPRGQRDILWAPDVASARAKAIDRLGWPTVRVSPAPAPSPVFMPRQGDFL